MSSQKMYDRQNEEEKKLLEKNLNELQKSNNEIIKEYFEIKQKHRGLQQANFELSQENTNLQKTTFKLHTMNAEIAQALKFLENSEEYGKDLKEKYEGFREAAFNFTSFSSGENGNVLSSFANLEECEEKRKELESKIAHIENKIAEGEKSIQEEIPKKEAEIQEIMDKIKKYVQRKVETENEGIQLSGCCDDMKQEIETKTKEIFELEKYKDELQSRMAAFEITAKQNSEDKKDI